MRITNKIMQNNSLYNINNNKITEDQWNTMMATGKKITRPSDDPVIAIRALRLRSNVTQLSQYYEKNCKDAESWLDVTGDALSTVTSVLTDCVKQATKGANMDLTVDDLDIIISQLDSLAKEYYATGNVDYAGRYIFTGYRTDTPLTFDKTTSADYTNINDEFDAVDISESKRMIGKHLLDAKDLVSESAAAVKQSEIIETTVGRIRLSYNNLNYKDPLDDPIAQGNTKATLKWREMLTQPATSTVTQTTQVVNITYTTENNETRYVSIPVDPDGEKNYKVIDEGGNSYEVAVTNTGNYNVYINGDKSAPAIIVDPNGIVDSDHLGAGIAAAQTSIDSRSVSAINYNADGKNYSVNLPLLPAIGQTYQIQLNEEGFKATVNSDGTYTIIDERYTENADGTTSNNIIQVTGNGSVSSSYKESTLDIGYQNIIYSTTGQEEIDDAYMDLYEHPTGARAYLNAATGEILLNKELEDKLVTMPDLINTRCIDVIYDKKEWESGDIRPENLFACDYTDTHGNLIRYNKGNAAHNIAYDVGFAQSVIVNTTADAVFTTDVKRNVEDLRTILNELQQINGTIKTLREKRDGSTDADYRAKLDVDIASATKVYDHLRQQIQKEFEHKITSMQQCLDVANIAVTDNGTRSKRLDLINSRLMTQTTTFQTLQSENEDVDIAEAATRLTSAQVTYEASLMATGKISQTSLMNYI
ncbi:flagellin N-terminal helical domain-containing protein [Butyrivibrio sp. MC2021]|uniref:flagellin N-terminal helical domain-containing protein n=1 Tax=Butyrivibrio sp. MC2021 TaxID=1408306 RepID=UPI0006842C02|nr:flagellin [Butyrivibrio sp. MC2021]